MGFNFPNTPSEGTLYTGPNGVQYVFQNGVWMQVSGMQRLPSVFKRTVITASTTAFQFDAMTLYADVEVQGAGGGGGGAFGTGGNGLCAGGAGGGAGGYAKKLIEITAAVRAATKTIVIGAGGTAGASTNPGTGGTGGNTTYGDTVNALAGNGAAGGFGAQQSGFIYYANGGSGGTGTGGDVNVRGMPGGKGQSVGSSSQGTYSATMSGDGATARLGPGAQGVTQVSTVTPVGWDGNSAAGLGYGGGGSGGGANYNASPRIGGTGAPGCVVITEYR